jgi:hypothetical protein
MFNVTRMARSAAFPFREIKRFSSSLFSGSRRNYDYVLFIFHPSFADGIVKCETGRHNGN